MKWVMGLLLFALALGVALPGTVRLGLADLPGPADEDLALVPPGRTPEPNAFDALMRAAQALPETDALLETDAFQRTDAVPEADDLDATVRERLLAEPFEPEAAEALLDAHREVLTHFEAALAAPGFRMPVVAWDEDLPNVQGWFTAARLHALSVRHDFEGRPDRSAGPAVRALLELGQSLQADPAATWVHWIAGAEFKEVALRTLIASTATWRPTPGASHAWSRTLETFLSKPEDERSAWAGEYRATRASLLESTPSSRGFYSFQPNRTLALQAKQFRSLQARAGHACAELEPEPEALESPSTLSLFLRGLRPNAVGEILVEVARPSGNRFALRRCAADTLLAATRLAIALAASKHETERLPRDLAELVPTYIDAIPRAAYDDTLLRLDPSGPRIVAAGSPLPEATPTQQSPEYRLPF